MVSMTSLKTYKTGDGYIGKIDASQLKPEKSDDVLKFVVILDQSGSMGNSVPRFVNEILPLTLKKLKMENKEVDLITFSNSSDMYKGNSDYYQSLSIRCNGCTCMSYAVRNLEKLFKEYMMTNNKLNIRLLTISDGYLHDQNETLNEASRLFSVIKDKLIINSQAIRFFTSSSEPDTRGLSSMLQFNSMTTPQLIDINADLDIESIAEMITELFINDGLGLKITLNSDEMIFKENPWSEPKCSIDLNKGENTFWLSKLPENLYNEDGNIQIELCEDVKLDNYKSILDDKIKYFIQKLKVLKIVNTETAKNEMNLIVQYFENFENHLMTTDFNDDSLLSEAEKFKIQNRMNLLRKRIKRSKESIAQLMKEIQNNDRVAQLNSRQLADFLRNVDSNKDGKSLSRRGLNEGIEFDEIARKEALEMANHFDEIKDIDDTHHSVSFYSTSTTMEGIKFICELAKDKNLLENVTAIDIIKLLNLVGIGCDAPIGNYTDPMVYRLNDLYLGCFISLSDVLTASEYSGGKNNLEDFNTRKIIINAIPFFEDQRIHQFLLKYAPKLLEYTASIGMRRVLVDIPNTYEYLIQSGIQYFCQSLSTNRSEAAIHIFKNLIQSYEVASSKHFNYLNKIITDQIELYKTDQEAMKYHIYLDDNSIANMTIPFIHMIKKNQMNYMSKVLRCLFCHEVHKLVNKMIKKQDDQQKFIRDYLVSLLGIECKNHETPLPELFGLDENPIFYDQYEINYEKIDKFFNIGFRIMYIPFEPYYIKALFENDKLKAFKELDEYNEDNIKKYLGINYDLNKFKLYAIVQAFLYRKNDERMDTDTKTMKIIDIGDENLADEMVKECVRKEYQMDYEQRLTKQRQKELDLLEDNLASAMIRCKTITEFKRLFKEGRSKGATTAKIENVYSPGFEKLRKKIISIDDNDILNVPLINKKIYIIIYGKDENDNIVWNNGNVYRGDIEAFGEIVKKIDCELWENILIKYKKNCIHKYRKGGNRHGHSDELPSYWALGYKSLEEMFSSVSQKEIDEYKRKHIGCCGL